MLGRIFIILVESLGFVIVKIRPFSRTYPKFITFHVQSTCFRDITGGLSNFTLRHDVDASLIFRINSVARYPRVFFYLYLVKC